MRRKEVKGADFQTWTFADLLCLALNGRGIPCGIGSPIFAGAGSLKPPVVCLIVEIPCREYPHEVSKQGGADDLALRGDG